MTKRLAIPLIGIAALGGLIMGLAGTIGAQTTAPSASASPPAANTAPSSAAPMPHGMRHAPLGGDGNVTAINGTTVSMQEEADEGGAIYTVDASGATVMKDGATAQLTDIKVGDKIFVQGTVTGTNVKATSISAGFPGHHWDKEGAKNTLK